jgi:Protein of unknown function (DUF1573)
MGRLTILAGMFLALVLFVTSVYVVYTQREAKQQAVRDKNIRDAGLEERVKKRKEAALVKGKPVAITPETVFEFGEISGQSTLSHTFKIRNAGDAPLTLKVDKPSCTCIVAKSVKDVLAPGEETELELGFNPQGKINDVIQWADVYTNDPNRNMIRFQLVGRTIKKIWADGDSLLFRDLQPLEERAVNIHLYSIYEKGFDVVNFVSEPKELVVKAEPLTAEELLVEGNPKSGVRIVATFPKSLGTQDGSLAFSIRPRGVGAEEHTTMNMELSANRLGMLGMYGKYVDELGRMKFEQIPHGKGLIAKYNLKARGEDKLLKVRRLYVEPDFVKVTIVPAENAETTGLHTMLVEIPPDAPEVDYLGKTRGKIEIDFEQEVYNRKKFYFELSFAIAKLDRSE